MRNRTAVTLVAAVVGALGAGALAADLPPAGELDALIHGYLAERDATVQLAPPRQLARRMAVDFTGVLPTLDDLTACDGKTPGEIYDHFAAKGPLPHTRGLAPYVWANLLADADDYLLSNSTQFSQALHVRELVAELSQVYTEHRSFQDFARWALTSQMFLSRFPSGADRANAAFFIFLGRDSLASEVPLGDMWNGYRLRNPGIAATQAETNPDYHVYDYDPARCTGGQVLCEATLWGTAGKTPAEAVELVVTSPLFAEGVVARYWARLIGQRLPGADFPELRRALVRGLIAHDFDIPWLTREIATSAAYAQEMMFR